jgi:hypothetical protein
LVWVQPGGKRRTLEVGKVGLLVELGALVAERVDDVVDLDGLVLDTLVGLLSRSVGTDVWSDANVRPLVSLVLAPFVCTAGAT